jgi:hypothetical protein
LIPFAIKSEKFADYEVFSADINGTAICVEINLSPSSHQEEVVIMFNKAASAGILGLIVLCTGCTMCCHPYDYCGPVYEGCGQCGSNVRAGSILPGGGGQALSVNPEQDIDESTTPSIEQGTPNVEEYEGATQILSVTDRKVEDSQEIAKSLPAGERSAPVLAQPVPAKRQLQWR